MQENLAYAQTKVAEESVTSNLVSKIQNANNRQRELIYNLEDKLHSILNLRQPSKDTQGAQEAKPIADFATAMDSEIFALQINNDRLEKMMEHLIKIV